VNRLRGGRGQGGGLSSKRTMLDKGGRVQSVFGTPNYVITTDKFCKFWSKTWENIEKSRIARPFRFMRHMWKEN